MVDKVVCIQLQSLALN